MRRFLIVFLIGSIGGFSAAKAEVTLTEPQQEMVHRLENTLAQTATFRARFRQTALESGAKNSGMVLVARPGRLRFTYDPPSPLSLIANDGKVVFQDTSVGQVTTLPLDRTPLGLLLRPHPHFYGDVTLADFQEKRGKILLKVVRTANMSEGELTLIFQAHSLALEGWDVVDSQGKTTQIRLSNIHTDISIDPKEFDLPKED